MNNIYFYFFICVCTACGFPEEVDEGNNKKTNSREEVVRATSSHQDTLSGVDYNIEVVLFDSTSDDRLERLFVVTNNNDVLFLKESICFLRNEYNLDERVSISFFSEKKYANYVSVLFSEENGTLPISEYENWKNDHYLAEYDFKSNFVTLFPARNGSKEKTTVLPCK